MCLLRYRGRDVQGAGTIQRDREQCEDYMQGTLFVRGEGGTTQRQNTGRDTLGKQKTCLQLELATYGNVSIQSLYEQDLNRVLSRRP